MWPRWLAWTVVLGALLMVFLAYFSPHLARDLADRMWACF